MEMQAQTIINLAGGAILVVLGWLANEIWSAVKSLREDLHKLEVDLPSHYVKRDEFVSGIREIREVCERIFSKIDKLEIRKVDKVDKLP